ncbi:MAG: glycine C-acetyltransferase [Anaerolineaceae bacterium]|jgi:glycine C-acetyltransferase
MTDRLGWIDEELQTLKETGFYNTIRTLSSPQGSHLIVDGKRVLNFCSNNYLGLANHPKLVEAANKAMAKYGIGPAAVRSIAGTMNLHIELEQRMAKFKRVEGAVGFQSGFTANGATIPAMVGKGDVIFSDELNHASIIDGSRLSGAKIVRFAHCDPQALEEAIKSEAGSYRRALMVTDGVFSMDGDVAPLDKLVEICEKYDVMSMVDDAHGEGVLGEGGRGIVDEFKLHGRVDIELGTFSKAFGVVGGMVAGKAKIAEYLKQRGRPFLFSSAVSVPDTAACIAAVDLLEESTELVDRLWSNARFFRQEMQGLGFDTGVTATPITPVMLGDVQLAREFSRKLYDNGLFAMALGFPTVPKGKARIRVMISATHSQQDLEEALGIFDKVGKELGVRG